MRRWLSVVLPAVFPYTAVFALIAIFGDNRIVEVMFQNNVYLMLLCIPVFWVVVLIDAIAVAAVSRLRKWNARDFVLRSMVMKWVAVPAYVIHFFMGVACLFTIFTIGFSVALAVLDGMAILASGLVGVAAVMRCRDEGILTGKETLVHGVLQFVFCADLVSAIMIYRKARQVQGQGRATCDAPGRGESDIRG